MQTQSIQTNWQSNTEAKHWIKHSIVPVVLLMVFLYLPQPWGFTQFQPDSVIEIELLENKTTSPKTLTKEPKPIEQPVINDKPVIQTTDIPVETPPPTDSKIVKNSPNEVTTNATDAHLPNSTTTEQTESLKVNAGDVMEMIQNRTSIDITSDFQARSGPASDFYIPEQQIQNWMSDIPFLDESVDKPKLQMKFYAEGFEGSIEKFFDKITISKTFTTKYGTKIHCALVGIIVACSWK